MHQALEGDDTNEDPKRNPKDDKKLSPGEIQKLKDAGWDHRSKGNGGGKYDLYKDKKGNIYKKPKGNVGEGEAIDFKIKDGVVTAAAIGTAAAVGAGILYYGGKILEFCSKRIVLLIIAIQELIYNDRTWQQGASY